MCEQMLPRGSSTDHPQVRRSLPRHISGALTWGIYPCPQPTVVAIEGELDVCTAPLLAEPLLQLADVGSDIILEMAGLRFCDCAGLSLFLRVQRHARFAGGSLRLTAPTAYVRRLITVLELHDVLRIAAAPAGANARAGSGHHSQATGPAATESGRAG